MLLSTGEQISVALCAMALEAMGLPCVSLTAWQVGIQTTKVHSDARIKKIDTERIKSELDQHRIVLVTGFQGVDRLGEDFAQLVPAGTPTFFAFIGSRNAEKGITHTNHQAQYTVDEDILVRGAAFEAQFALDYLANA